MLHWPDDAAAICRRIADCPASVKFVLITKNEVERLERWILHHLPIAGPQGLVVFDNHSTDPGVRELLSRYDGLIQFHGWSPKHTDIHKASKQEPLYAALRASCRHYGILDTDERAYWSDGSRMFAGSEFVSRLGDEEGRLVHPGLWLPNYPGSHEIYDVRQTPLPVNLFWGKPLFGRTIDVRGFVNHNWQFVEQNPGHELWSGYVVCHDHLDTPALRERANVAKLLAHGVVTSTDELESIIADGRIDAFPPRFRKYANEIVKCRSAVWIPLTEPRARHLAIREDGVIQFGSPEVEREFRTFTVRRRFEPTEFAPTRYGAG